MIALPTSFLDSSALWWRRRELRPLGVMFVACSAAASFSCTSASSLPQDGGDAAQRLDAMVSDVPYACMAHPEDAAPPQTNEYDAACNAILQPVRADASLPPPGCSQPDCTCDLQSAYNGLVSIWAVSHDLMYAAGGRTVLKWSGQHWENLPLPVGISGSAVWADSESDVWLAGNGVYRFDGQSWSAVSDTSALAVSGTGANDIWVTTPDQRVLHWNGRGWTPTPSPPVDTAVGLETGHVFVSRSCDVWVGDKDAHLFRWSGTSWFDAGIPARTATWTTALLEMAPNDVWAASRSYVGDPDGIQVQHFDGTGWTTQSAIGLAQETPVKLLGSADTDLWMMTDRRLLHYDGHSWSWAAPTPNAMADAWFFSACDVWAVRGNLWHWDGATWRCTAPGP